MSGNVLMTKKGLAAGLLDFNELSASYLIIYSLE
jgi:hypothetical protein